ncbi:hypothetical protein ACVWYK_004653 [Bradyrhizobium sp. USDA 4470]
MRASTLLQMERFWHVIVGAGVEALHLVAPAVARGEDQNRHGATVAAPGLQHRDAVLLGQADVEHHGVIRFVVAEIVPLLSVEGTVDDITGVRQRLCELAIEIGVVLNNKQAHASLQK